MAAIHVLSKIATKLAALSPGGVKAFNNRGRVRSINDVATIAASSDVGSTVSFGKISSSAVLLASSRIYSAALGSSTTLSFGVKDNAKAGVSSKTAAFLSAGAVGASAATLTANAAVAIGKTGQQIWQVLGLTSDPKCDLDLVATLGGATSSAGGDVAIELQIVED